MAKAELTVRELERVNNRFTSAKAVAEMWISLHETCFHYTVPHRNLFYWLSPTQGQQKNTKVYDTTPVAGVNSLVSKIQGSIMPPGKKWYTVKSGTRIADDKRDEVDKILEKATDILFENFTRSNFDIAVNESLHDYVIGTLVMTMKKGPDINNPVVFNSHPLARVAIEDDQNGCANNVYRWWDSIRVLDIMELWPEAKIPVECISGYEQNPNYEIGPLCEATIYEQGSKSKKGKWCYVLYWNDKQLIYKELKRTPFLVARWSKISNEAWGRGPVMSALPSILTLNTLAYFELSAANLNVFKPFMGFSDSIFNPYTFQQQPGTIIPIAPAEDGKYPLVPLPDVSNPAFAQVTAMDLRQQINALLYVSPLGPINAPARTATEVAIRQKNVLEEIGPAFTARIQYEFLSKIIEGFIEILQEWGIMPFYEIDGQNIQLQFSSPLMQAQGQEDVEAVMKAAQAAGSIVGPDSAIFMYNPWELLPYIGDKLGVDKRLLNTSENIKQTLEAKAQQAQGVEDAAAEGVQEGVAA